MYLMFLMQLTVLELRDAILFFQRQTLLLLLLLLICRCFYITPAFTSRYGSTLLLLLLVVVVLLLFQSTEAIHCICGSGSGDDVSTVTVVMVGQDCVDATTTVAARKEENATTP